MNHLNCGDVFAHFFSVIISSAIGVHPPKNVVLPQINSCLVLNTSVLYTILLCSFGRARKNNLPKQSSLKSISLTCIIESDSEIYSAIFSYSFSKVDIFLFLTKNPRLSVRTH